MTSYAENELVIPALRFIQDTAKGVNTSQLIAHLTDVFKPSGHDIKLLAGRKDTYFSQKVRNLKSHNTFKRKNFATYQKSGKHGIWKITLAGTKYLQELDNTLDDMLADDIVTALKNQGFGSQLIKKEAKQDYSGLIIEEGSVDKVTSRQRNRSSKLRDIAIREFKSDNNGELFCVACDFNFYTAYGEIGKNFIEIHHLEPMHLKDIEGERITIEEAIKKVATVCSNCHRMIHRTTRNMLSIEDLRKILYRYNS
jgi:predicted HNH restriction endonuclease